MCFLLLLSHFIVSNINIVCLIQSNWILETLNQSPKYKKKTNHFVTADSTNVSIKCFELFNDVFVHLIKAKFHSLEFIVLHLLRIYNSTIEQNIEHFH